MLHILWMILKIILITLGILLGLILLLILLVLFVPIRYRAAASRQGEDIGGEARVSWLLSAVSVTAAYRDRQRSICIRILGIPLETLRKLPKRLRGNRRTAPAKERIPDREDPERHTARISRTSAAEKEESTAVVTAPPQPDVGTAGEPEPESPADGEMHGTENTAALWNRITAVWRRICRTVRALWSGIARIFRLIAGIPGRIGRFFHRITLTITGFYDKIDRWKTFLQDERTAAGIRLGWGELKKLLGHVSPRKITGNLTIGMENPAATGQLLALIGATIPLHRNCVAVEPVFDRKVLEADVRMRGRIFLFYVLIRGMKLYFDKNIKFIMKEFNKEG